MQSELIWVLGIIAAFIFALGINEWHKRWAWRTAQREAMEEMRKWSRTAPKRKKDA